MIASDGSSNAKDSTISRIKYMISQIYFALIRKNMWFVLNEVDICLNLPVWIQCRNFLFIMTIIT